MFCTDSCHKQPLGEVLHSVEICFVTSLLNLYEHWIDNIFMMLQKWQMRSFEIVFYFDESNINSLSPGETMWWHRYGPTLVQVMACCLTAPSHCLNQCWLTIKGVIWFSPETNFTRSVHELNHGDVFRDYNFKIAPTMNQSCNMCIKLVPAGMTNILPQTEPKINLSNCLIRRPDQLRHHKTLINRRNQCVITRAGACQWHDQNGN